MEGAMKLTETSKQLIFVAIVGVITIVVALPFVRNMFLNLVGPDGVASREELYNAVTLVAWILGALTLMLIIILLYLASVFRKDQEEDRLKQAIEEAKMANKAKSDFLANMSHEIRTPMNAVLGMNEMILRESEDPDIVSYSENIDRAGKNLLSLINDILDLSKIESGKMELEEAEYSLVDVLQDLINIIHMRAEQKGLTFVYDVDPKIPDTLYGDAPRIRQIILNLLSNAVKYTNHGTVTLKVRQHPSAIQYKTTLLFEVVDTGIGIKEEDLGRLFRNFERLDQEKNKNVQGTGLGLSLSNSLIQLMKGSIEVTSVYRHGSTFIARIPQTVTGHRLVGNIEERIQDGPETQKRRYQVSFQAPKAKVLIVDDNEMNIAVVRNFLKKTGIQITSCDGGNEALTKMKEEHFDLILLDDLMPEMDGVETLRIAKAMSGNLCINTPIVCMTATVMVGAREKYISIGFSDYLPKPVRSADLEAMVAYYLPQNLVSHLDEHGAPILEEHGNTVDHAEQAPEDKVEPQKEKEDSLAEPLRQIDRKLGMEYSEGDADLYQDMLSMFADGYAEKSGLICKAKDEQDWKNYTVLVHALKSTALSIGAKNLSGKARAMELAGKKITMGSEAEKVEGLKEIGTHQEELMADYRVTATEAGRIRDVYTGV